MKQAFNNAQDTRQQIVAQMIGMQQQIEKLAPHPDGPKASSFKADSRAIQGDDNDAILGSLMMESFFGAAWGELAQAMNVPEWAQNVQWDNAVEVVDEYYTERSNDRANNGNNNYQMGVNGALSGTFYRRSIEAYKNDLSDRQKMEATYSKMSRKLGDLDNNEGYSAPTLH